MIVNLIDLRENAYRWKTVLAVLESAAKNNEAEGDSVEVTGGVEIDYAEREGISVRDAVIWAEQVQGKVTLYLYDYEKE